LFSDLHIFSVCMALIIGFFCGVVAHAWRVDRLKKLKPLERKKQREIREKLKEIRERQRRFVAARKKYERTKQKKY